MNDIMLTGFSDEICANFSNQLSLVKELGIHYIELRGVDGKNISELSMEELQLVKKKIDAAGIKISAIGSPIGKIGIDEDFEAHFEVFKKIVSYAKALNTSYIRIFSFYIPKEMAPEAYKTQVLSRLKQFISYAKEQNVILLHENEKEIYGDSPERCLELMSELGCENFSAIFDFANFLECGVDTSHAYHLLKGYIKYIHIKDCKKTTKEIVPAGYGDGAIETILSDLKASGYSGFLSLEPHLANFDGLAELERGEINKQQADGFTTWKLAFNALNALLDKIGWKPTL